MNTMLIRQTIHDRRRALIGWSIGVLVLVAVMIVAYPAVRDRSGYEELLQQYPEALKALFGIPDGSMGSGANYLYTELFSFMLPLLFILCGVNWGVDVIAGEEDRHLLEPVLSRPVARTHLVLSRLSAVLLMLLVIGAVVAVGLWVGDITVSLDIGVIPLLTVIGLEILLAALFAAFGCALGCLTGRRGLSLATCTTTIVMLYFVNALAPLVSWLEKVRWVSPFYWSNNVMFLVDGAPTKNWLVLGGLLVAMVVLAVWGFARRDVRS